MRWFSAPSVLRRLSFLNCDTLCSCLSRFNRQPKIQDLLSKYTGHAFILLKKANTLDAWDDKFGAVDDVGVDAALKTIFSKSIPDCFSVDSGFVSDDEVVCNVDLFVCHSSFWFRFLLSM